MNMWQSGDVTLYLGDCMDVMKGMEDNSVDTVITDPPWNVGKDYGIYKDNLSYEKYTELIKNLKMEWARVTKENQYCIVLGSEILKQWWDEYPEAKVIIVKLGAIVLTRKNNMHLQWKPIITTCTSNEFATDLWEDIRWPGEGYYFNEPRYGHPAMTPLKLMKRLISRFTSNDNIVIDPFLGVGTTGVAAVQSGRKFIGIEIEPKYFEIAKKRIQEAQMQLRLGI
jgi:DNA modification methylase